MSGKTTGLTALEMRKQLLVVESELNRAYLVNELQAMKAGVRHVTGQVTDQLNMLGSLANSITKFGSMFTGFFDGLFGHGEQDEDDKKSSWLSTLFNGARTGFSVLAKLWPDRR